MKAPIKICALILAFSLLLSGCTILDKLFELENIELPTVLQPTEAPTEAPTEPPVILETGYIATLELEAAYCDEAGAELGKLPRGAEVEYEITEDGICAIHLEEQIVYLAEGASIVADMESIIPAHTLYVRTAEPSNR